jgi:hypothetical protein
MTTIPYLLAGPLRKIDRAKQHIRDLEAAVQRFQNSSANVVGTKPNAQGTQRVYYVAGLADIDVEIPLIAGDAIQNIRSAWDHLAYGLVCQGVNGPVEPWVPGYPIARDAAKYPAFRDGKVKGATKAAIDAIDATKPYKGGTNELWQLDELNNRDKHRLLLTAVGYYGSADLGADMSRLMRQAGVEFPIMHVFFKLKDPLCPLKVGDELFIGEPLHEEVNKDMKFPFDVAFNEPGVLECQPMLKTLQDMANLCDRLIRSFASVV